MKRIVSSLIGAGIIGAVVAAPLALRAARRSAEPGWSVDKSRFTLPNGWRLTPAGKSIQLPGDMPGNILVTSDGKHALVNTSGFHDHSLNLIDLETGRLQQSLILPQAWLGLAMSSSDEILLSGGRVTNPEKTKAVLKVRLQGAQLSLDSGFNLPGLEAKDQFVSNLISTEDALYVLDIQHDTVFMLRKTGELVRKVTVGYRPYAGALSPDGLTLAVSNWGDKSVSLLDAKSLELKRKVNVQDLPCALCYAEDGRLFVANSGANTLSVIENEKVVETIRTAVDRGSRIGSSPSALALSPDSKAIYVANSGNNCVAVINIRTKQESKVEGFIPTGRYPSSVTVTPDGKQLLVGTAKGFYGPNAGSGVRLEGNRIRGRDLNNAFQYIGEQLAGHLSIIQVPSHDQLVAYSRQVVENQPLGVAQGPSAAERSAIEKQAFAKIKHVIYVIKENRTYDQELGDIPKGNGDPTLTIFGEKVTPNLHKVVNTFTLFDNLYTDGEVSQVGHQWTDAAYANDYEEKQWSLGYSGRGQVESDRRLSSSPGDYLWSAARKKGLSARVFGEYVDVQEDHDSLSIPEIKADPEKYGYSASFEKIFARGGRDTEKVEDFLREMRDAEKTGKWPNLMVMALPEDHTNGMRAGSYSPYAMVANNDNAVGKLIDSVSHSKFWDSTAIFIIQDDAQAGPDHVDSHRTVGMVVSPYVKRGHLDSTMYSTASMLRTMGLILGIPPLTQYDAKATPMYNAFTVKPNFEPFNFAPPQVDLNEKNPTKTALAQRSAKLDFSEIDRADWDELNRILWEAYRPGIPYPAPVHGL